MRRLNADALYDAFLLSFQGVGYREISKRLGVTPATLVGWAKRPEWKSLEKDLHAEKRQQMLKALQRKDTSE